MKHGKKYMDSAKAVDSTKQYDAAEALDLVCKNAKAKFDETIEVHIRTGCDGPGRHLLWQKCHQPEQHHLQPQVAAQRERFLSWCAGQRQEHGREMGADERYSEHGR